MTVLGARRDICARVEGVDQVFGSDRLKDLLALCDFMVLALAATAETIGLIGATQIARTRCGVLSYQRCKGQQSEGGIHRDHAAPPNLAALYSGRATGTAQQLLFSSYSIEGRLASVRIRTRSPEFRK